MDKKTGFTSAKGLKMTVDEKPNPQGVAFLRQQLVDFNQQRFEVKERFPLLININDGDTVVAGISGLTFGNWLLIDYLWVDESQRGEGLGQELLLEAEVQAKSRGCSQALLDTLSFQAKPFYEKYGYQTAFTMEHYPADGQRFFMTKML